MTNTAKTPHPVTAGHSERNISFDLIRILAIFLVMYNHRETYIFIIMCHTWDCATFFPCAEQLSANADHRFSLWYPVP